MQLGITIGHVTSTIKHESLQGWRLVIVQMIGATQKPEGDCVVAADKFGSAPGQKVILNSDGKAARELIGHDKSPVRWFVIAVVDENSERHLGT
jgi:ethanolamine utilization protein EutN